MLRVRRRGRRKVEVQPAPRMRMSTGFGEDVEAGVDWGKSYEDANVSLDEVMAQSVG